MDFHKTWHEFHATLFAAISNTYIVSKQTSEMVACKTAVFMEVLLLWNVKLDNDCY
jgi:hypothetical protein